MKRTRSAEDTQDNITAKKSKTNKDAEALQDALEKEDNPEITN